MDKDALLRALSAILDRIDRLEEQSVSVQEKLAGHQDQLDDLERQIEDTIGI